MFIPAIPVGAFGNGLPGGGPPDSYIFVIWSIKSCALSCPRAVPSFLVSQSSGGVEGGAHRSSSP
jgi:hypothetical protein